MSYRKKSLLPRFLLGVFLLVFFTLPKAFAEEIEEPDLVILENKPWTTTNEGYQHKSVIGKRRESGRPFELVFLKFNPFKFQLKIRHYSEFSEHPEYVGYYSDPKSQVIAAINGGYFDPQGKHLGYLKIGNSVLFNNIATHPIYSGVIVPENKPVIIHRSEFHPTRVSDALQVGPLLIRNGKENPGLRNTHRIHYRSGIGCDKSGMFVLFATNTNYSGISWDDLVDVLQMEDFDFQNVINLDGGGSTQMLFTKDGEKVFYRGLTPVPTAVVVEKRVERVMRP